MQMPLSHSAGKLAGQIKEGGGVAIHCRAGIGRSGMMTCAVLAQLGMPVDDALKHIADYRGLRVPDTEEQADWLRENLVPVFAVLRQHAFPESNELLYFLYSGTRRTIAGRLRVR